MKKNNKKHTIPSKMMAVFMDKETRLLYAKQVPVPVPRKGEVLIKMAAAPINPSDLVRLRNMMPDEIENHIPGIEGSGRVVAAGKGILPHLFLGKRVSCCAVHASSGTWAEYCVTGAATCCPLGKSISDEQGSMLLVNPLTAVSFFDMIRRGRHKAIISTAAAGALGKMIAHLANKTGIEVVNIVRNVTQENNLRQSGAKYVLNSSEDDFPEQLNSLSEKLQVSLALDAIGGQQTRQLIKAISYKGTVIIYGNLSEASPEFDSRNLTWGSKTVTGFYLPNWIRDHSFIRTLRNLIRVRTLIKKEIATPVQSRSTFNKVQKAVDTYLKNMTSGKILLVPEQSF
jgi:NADPH:quinone reductase